MSEKEKEIKELFENLDEKGQDILEMVAKRNGFITKYK